MTTAQSLDSIGHAISRLAAELSPSRRSMVSQLPLAALALLLTGGAVSAGAARSAGTSRVRVVRSSRAIATIIVVFNIIITVRGPGAAAGPFVWVTVAEAEEPDRHLLRLRQRGSLTPGMIELITLVGNLELNETHIQRFNALLESFGLKELMIPLDGRDGDGLALIIVLFILLVIIGAGFGLEYGEN
jgi:uncharacterized protein (TIGR01732 family)